MFTKYMNMHVQDIKGIIKKMQGGILQINEMPTIFCYL